MRDPAEGVTADGTIRTGAAHARIDDRYREVLQHAIDAVAAPAGGSLFLYGSVATGMARSPSSDIDLLTVDVPAEDATRLADRLTMVARDLCRGVEIATATRSDFVGPTDTAHGGRVFLHHYCVHLAGPKIATHGPYPADARAARGFNGDIGRHLQRWRSESETEEPEELARRVARKTLLAAAGVTSIRRAAWTTDRATGAGWWAADDPASRPEMDRLLQWSEGGATIPTRHELVQALDGIVGEVVTAFQAEVGLLPDGP